MSAWVRRSKAQGWRGHREECCLDVCLEHKGRYFGLRVLLSGLDSPFGRRIHPDEFADTEAKAQRMLADSVSATRWLLEHPDDVLPPWVQQVADSGGLCHEFNPVHDKPSIGWTRAPGKEEPSFAEQMRACDWDPL